MTKTYRNSFKESDVVRQYLTRYSEATLSSYLYELEKNVLKKIGEKNIKKIDEKIKYLDYACGTGRILETVIEEMRENCSEISAVGMDISAEMLAMVGDIPAELIKIDLSKEKYKGEKFNLITCFRFFLHAEPDLRVLVLKNLHDILQEDGVLVINNHGSSRSFIGFMRTFNPRIHCLSDPNLIDLLEDVGFKVEQIYGFGFFPGKIVNWRLFRILALKFENWLLDNNSFLGKYGIQKIYICKKN